MHSPKIRFVTDNTFYSSVFILKIKQLVYFYLQSIYKFHEVWLAI